MEFPRLSRGNPGIQELKDWLKAQREAGRDALETASGDRILHLQGRLELIGELLRNIDPAHRGYGE